MNNKKTHHWCMEHKAHVEADHKDKFPGHRVYSFGLILKKQSITRPYQRKLTGTLPTAIDMRSVMKNGGFVTFNQGQQGSCTANCGCEDKALMEIKAGTYSQPFSRAFLYYQERVILGTTDADSGANMINIGQALTEWGVCFDATMPYNQFVYTVAPSQAAYTQALYYICGNQNQLASVDDIKSAVYESSITVKLGSARIGIPVPSSFMNAVDNGGWVPVPNITEELLGGHAMLVVGYDDNMKGPDGNVGYFIVLQSWGSVGDMSSGLSTFYIPYAFFTCVWVVAQGTDNWQQVNADVQPSPSGLTIVASPTTIVNDGSTTVGWNVTGVKVGDTIDVGLVQSDGTPLAEWYNGTATSTIITGTGNYKGAYTGSAYIQAGDLTTNVGSNKVQVTITAPSVCKVGNTLAAIGNTIARALGRKGRFYYLIINE